MDKEVCYIYTKEYYSATEGNEFESVELRWMNLEPVIQSSVQFSCSVVSNSFATPWTATRVCYPTRPGVAKEGECGPKEASQSW